jgi:hypothetical protein
VSGVSRDETRSFVAELALNNRVPEPWHRCDPTRKLALCLDRGRAHPKALPGVLGLGRVTEAAPAVCFPEGFGESTDDQIAPCELGGDPAELLIDSVGIVGAIEVERCSSVLASRRIERSSMPCLDARLTAVVGFVSPLFELSDPSPLRRSRGLGPVGSFVGELERRNEPVARNDLPQSTQALADESVDHVIVNETAFVLHESSRTLEEPGVFMIDGHGEGAEGFVANPSSVGRTGSTTTDVCALGAGSGASPLRHCSHRECLSFSQPVGFVFRRRGLGDDERHAPAELPRNQRPLH